MNLQAEPKVKPIQNSILVLAFVTPDETECKTTVIHWAAFLGALEQFCIGQGWQIEYGDIDDYSCAIFGTEMSSLPKEGSIWVG